MNRGSTLILRGVIYFIGAAVLAVCLFGLPFLIVQEQVGYYRPILIGLYVPAVPFFYALYQALALLRYINENKAFSPGSVKALRIIKYCALAISGLFVLGMPYIFYAAERDDAPGVVVIGLVIISASFVIATFAGVLQKLMQSAMEIKSENELTV